MIGSDQVSRLRLKNIADLVVDQLPATTPPDFVFRYLDISTVGTGFLRRRPAELIYAEAPSRARQRVRAGDVIVSTVRTYLKSVLPITPRTADCIVSTGFAVLRPRGLSHPRWLGYVLQSAELTDEVVRRSDGVAYPAVRSERLMSVPITAPSHGRQGAIVRYLDHAVLQTGRAINAERQFVELLDEVAAAHTWDCVRGSTGRELAVRPGVAWMGEIPRDWARLRIKDFLHEVDRRTTTGAETLLSLRMREGLVQSSNYSDRPQVSSRLVGYKLVEPGMLVMNRMRASIGLFAIADQQGLVSPDYATFEVRPGAPIHLPYLLLLLKSRQMGAVIRSESRGLGTGSAGFLRIYTDRFGAIALSLPSVREQQRRVAEAEERNARVNAALANSLREIELLEEYRTRLISDAVTGRRDVEAESAALPEIDQDELDAVLSAASSDDGGVEVEE